MNEKIKHLQKLIDEAKSIVFFGGAGVSTESGIPDFRSVDGLFNTKYAYPPEEIISRTFFFQNTKEFYRFYLDKLLLPGDVQPNITHLFLTELEKRGKLKAVVTQNIDGLHQKAGTKNVIELHGSILRNYCMKCHKFYADIRPQMKDGLPICECGGLIKPDVVLYEEGLNQKDISYAIKCISEADLLLVCGTSLRVYPAASLISYIRRGKIVIINRDATGYDREAYLVLNEKLGDVFGQLKP